MYACRLHETNALCQREELQQQGAATGAREWQTLLGEPEQQGAKQWEQMGTAQQLVEARRIEVTNRQVVAEAIWG